MGQNVNYHSIYFQKYPLANSVILMYDISKIESLKECNYYVERIKELCDKDIEVILLGNDPSSYSGKYEYKREVSIEEGENFAKLNNFKFMEVSSKTKEGVVESFEIAIWMALKNKRKRDNLKAIENDNNPKEKNKNCLIV